MRPLDILYVGTVPPHPGGSAVHAAYLLAGLQARGHGVRALAPRPAAQLDEPDTFAQRHPGMAITRYAVPWFSPDRAAASRDAEYRQAEGAAIRTWLPRLIEHARPAVIVIGRESIAHDVPEIARDHAIPMVLLVHGGGTLNDMLGAPERPTSQALLQRFRTADVVVTVAHHLAERLRPLALGRIVAIPNPVDLEHFSPGPRDADALAALGIPRDALVMLHASNLKPVKRALDLVASARLAAARCPSLVYVVVGAGPCRAEMEAACREAGLLERFRFTGWVEHGRMPGLMRLADVVIMPSESEGQAHVYLEAQACRRVLLASDIPAAREVVVHGETGLLFPVGDVPALTEETLRAARDASLRAAIGDRARERVRAHALPPTLAAYEQVFRAVAGRSRIDHDLGGPIATMDVPAE